MSNQSGIVASEELRQFLASSRDGKVRCMKVVISDEENKLPSLELEKKFTANGSWEEDWEKTVPSCVHTDFPCFVLFRQTKFTEVTHCVIFDLGLMKETILETSCGF